MEIYVGENRQQNEAKKEIPPTEDLMREHGVLKRILLIYKDETPERRKMVRSLSDQLRAPAYRFHCAEFHRKLSPTA